LPTIATFELAAADPSEIRRDFAASRKYFQPAGQTNEILIDQAEAGASKRGFFHEA